MNSKGRLTLRVSAICVGIALSTLVISSLVGVARIVRAQNAPAMMVVYNFRPATGNYPTGVIRDPAGNLYVATGNGGSNNGCYKGCGNILKLSSSGQPTVLYSFLPGSHGGGLGPSVLTRDAKGILYGVTANGGHFDRGSVFKLAPSGPEKTIYNFQAGGDGGYNPIAGLTLDSAGNLYGTTYYGGGTTACGGGGCGTIYKMTPSGSETVLYSFTGGTDGALPDASPVLDAAGNLYGTATEGGDLSCPLLPGMGCGTVWKLDTSGNFSVLYTFAGGTDGGYITAGLAIDTSGNLYGAAYSGGNLSCDSGYGCGTVFEINSSGNFAVLHTFAGGSSDGQGPEYTLLRDSAGNLYGTTFTGGDQSCIDTGGQPGCGVIYKVDASGNETILHFFVGGTTDGTQPEGALLSDGKGNLYGATGFGGAFDGGIIFAVRE
jgi:uncharacterized repeat protein (TIGR03803 family)